MEAESVIPPEVAPAHGDPELHTLEPRLVPYWMLVNAITTTVLVGGIVLGVVVGRSQVPDYADLILGAGIGLGTLLVLTAVLQPWLAWLTWRYGIDDELLVARYGILFREEKTIPISRLQHVDLRRGPIERVFKLATLVVFTAGTEGAIFRVPGLSVERARGMRDLILAQRGDDVI